MKRKSSAHDRKPRGSKDLPRREAFKTLYKTLGWDQEQLATKLDVSKQSVARILAGNGNLESERELCELLRNSLDELKALQRNPRVHAALEVLGLSSGNAGLAPSSSPIASDVDAIEAKIKYDGDNLLRRFGGRRDLRKTLFSSVLDRLRTGGCVALVGTPGSGRTSMVYDLAQKLAGKQIPRVVHVVRDATDPRYFLKLLIEHCRCFSGNSVAYGFDPGSTPHEWGIMLQREMLRLRQSLEAPAGVALIDGLEELDCEEANWRRALSWLPAAIPGTIFVVSCAPIRGLLAALEQKGNYARIDLGGLDEIDRKEVFSAYASWVAEKEKLTLSDVVDFERAFDTFGSHPYLLWEVVQQAIKHQRDRTLTKNAETAFDLDSQPVEANQRLEHQWSQMRQPPWATSQYVGRRQFLAECLACRHESGLSLPILTSLLGLAEERAVLAGDVETQLNLMEPYVVRKVFRDDLPRYELWSELLSRHICGALGPAGTAMRHSQIVDVLARDGLLLDRKYTTLHFIDHAKKAGKSLRSVLRLVSQPVYLRDIIIARRGGSVGTLLRRLVTGAGDTGEALATALKSACTAPETVRALLANPTDALQNAREIADLAVCAEPPSVATSHAIAQHADEIFALAFRETLSPELLLEQVRFRYQYLDDWAGALSVASQLEQLARDDDVLLARTRLLKAQVLFDAGIEEGDRVHKAPGASGKSNLAKASSRSRLAITPQALLEAAAETFQRTGHVQELGEAHETLGVVVDASGAWREALEHYHKAELNYSKDNRLGLHRLAIGRAIAKLFTLPNGIHAALEELSQLDEVPELQGEESTSGDEPLGRWNQLRCYWLLNRGLLQLLAGQFDQARRTLARASVTSEQWALLSCQQLMAVVDSFQSADPESVLVNMEGTLEEFNRVGDQGDAWGEADNRINRGFLFLELDDRPHAVREFKIAYDLSRKCGYRVGKALAAWGLKEAKALGKVSYAEDLDFYQAHLSRLFARAGLRPFSPTYVLPLP